MHFPLPGLSWVLSNPCPLMPDARCVPCLRPGLQVPGGAAGGAGGGDGVLRGMVRQPPGGGTVLPALWHRGAREGQAVRGRGVPQFFSLRDESQRQSTGDGWLGRGGEGKSDKLFYFLLAPKKGEIHICSSSFFSIPGWSFQALFCWVGQACANGQHVDN